MYERDVDEVFAISILRRPMNANEPNVTMVYDCNGVSEVTCSFERGSVALALGSRHELSES
jgi:hypothetical protein